MNPYSSLILLLFCLAALFCLYFEPLFEPYSALILFGCLILPFFSHTLALLRFNEPLFEPYSALILFGCLILPLFFPYPGTPYVQLALIRALLCPYFVWLPYSAFFFPIPWHSLCSMNPCSRLILPLFC